MGITNWSIKHSVTIFVLIVCLIVTGLMSYGSLPREAEPDIEIPFVMVTVPYFGVSPADMETLVTNPLEEELEKLKDVEEMTSTSGEGISIVSIEFKAGSDMDAALADVRARVDLAEPELPPEAEDTIINEVSFSDFPIMNIVLSGQTGLVQLKRVAEQMEDDINEIKGILDVRIIGGLEREIRVEVQPELLQYYNISFNQIIGAIQSENLNMPGGSIDIGDQSYLVRVPGEFQKAQQIEEVVVHEDEGQIVRIKDIATVVNGYEEQETYSRIGQTPAVSIIVTRRAGENIIRITDELKELVKEYDEKMAGTVEYTILNDVSDQIRTQLEELENNILTGLLLVLIILLFFLSGWKRALLTIGTAAIFTIAVVLIGSIFGIAINPWVPITIAMLVGFVIDPDGGLRTALFVGTAIPMSMLISFAVLAALGITLNIVVLFSLVLALGMLVDNAIVIVENIYRHMTLGKSRIQASMDGVEEVAWPVIASTATTVGAFIPMLFWTGIMGEFMKYLPMTVIIVLLSSLFVALVINPVLCATLMKVDPEDVDPNASVEDYDEADSLPDNFIYRSYRRLLEFSTLSFKGVVITIVLAFATLIGTFLLFGQFNSGVEFFPETTPERIRVTVDLPQGSNVEASNRTVKRIEQWLTGKKIINHMSVGVGAGNDQQATGGSGNGTAHASSITVEFIDRKKQTTSPDTFILDLRAFLDTIPGAEFEIQTMQGGPPTGPPINLEIVGENYNQLQKIATKAERILKDVDGVVDLQSDFEAGRQELTVDIDRELAGKLGLSTQTIANTVRAAINGIEASQFRENDEEYDIIVQHPEAERAGVDDVRNLWIKNPDGERIQLQEIADIHVEKGWGAISHLDGDRVITLSAETKEGLNSNQVLARAEEVIKDSITLPPGYDYRFTGQNEDQAEAAAFLSKAMLAALFIIALVLITQFNSVIQPAIILFSVLLSLIGVLWMLMIRDMPFGVIMTGIGIISLAGVVVNNAIVLVDYINLLRDRGKPLGEAVVTAGLVRFRPVLLTAITTILSLIPTVLGISLDAKEFQIVSGGTSVEMWGNMANAVVGGLFVATILTLLVVPALYIAFEWMRYKTRQLLPSARMPGEEGSTTESPAPEEPPPHAGGTQGPRGWSIAPDSAPSDEEPPQQQKVTKSGVASEDERSQRRRRHTSPGLTNIRTDEQHENNSSHNDDTDDDNSDSNPSLPEDGGSHT